eukprot:SAG31_NODE_3028_length_4768_cov_5.420433_5_plen_88_part_00
MLFSKWLIIFYDVENLHNCVIVLYYATVQIGDELLRSEEFRSKRVEEGLAVTQAAKWQDIMSVYPAQLSDVEYLYGKLLGRDVDSDT